LLRLEAFITEAELDQRSKAKKEKTVPDRRASLYDAGRFSSGMKFEPFKQFIGGRK